MSNVYMMDWAPMFWMFPAAVVCLAVCLGYWWGQGYHNFLVDRIAELERANAGLRKRCEDRDSGDRFRADLVEFTWNRYCTSGVSIPEPHVLMSVLEMEGYVYDTQVLSLTTRGENLAEERRLGQRRCWSLEGQCRPRIGVLGRREGDR